MSLTQKRWFRVAGVVLLVLAVWAGMMEFRAREELGRARQARDAGEVRLAMKHFARTMNWYVPGGGAARAGEELLALGLELAEKGRDKEAAVALSRVRAGLQAARHLFTPRRDLIDRADVKLAELRARERLGPAAGEEAVKKKTREYLTLLGRPPAPKNLPALGAVLGFFAWVGLTLWGLGRVFGRGLGRASTWGYALAWAAGYVLWVWGMSAA